MPMCMLNAYIDTIAHIHIQHMCKQPHPSTNHPAFAFQIHLSQTHALQWQQFMNTSNYEAKERNS